MTPEKTDNLDRIFKAFFPTKGKVPARAYTNPENQFKYDEVCNMPSFAGLLAEDAILVDIDDGEQGELLLSIIKALGVKCRVHKTTRGIHAFFVGHSVQHTKTHVTNAIGLETDYKLGSRNGITILKLEGVPREVVYETDTIDPLPMWLYPVKTAPEFMKMEIGDGRNNTLYQYILTLQAAGLTKEQSRETINIINRFVLKESLPKDELNTILRDDAFPSVAFYDNRGKLLVRKFEEHFCNEVHAIKLDGVLHIYADGVYVSGEELIRGKMLSFLPDLTLAQRNEILNRSKDRIQVKGRRAPAYLILFKNGTYDMRSGSMTESSPDNVITNLIDWDYNPNAYSEIMDRTLDKLACNDAALRLLLEEMVGYCFYRRNELGKAFILLGDASNGKSTFMDIVAYALGDDNTSSLALQQFGDKFETAEMHNKLANIGDDIPSTWIADPSIFKKIVTGDRLTVQRKNGHPFQINPYVKPILSANEMPRIDDKTGAVKRRLVPIPFNAKFSPSDPDFDPYIKDKLKTDESIEYLIRLGIIGLARLLKNKKFSTNAEIESELKTIDELNNPIIGFIEEVGEESIVNQTTKSVYDKYRDYCIESGLQSVALNSFVRQMNTRIGTVTVRRMIQGTMYKIFVPKEAKE